MVIVLKKLRNKKKNFKVFSNLN